MPKDQYSLATTPRQKPVSCSLCRKRKLRCSRIAPCSNCIARGVNCDLEVNGMPETASVSNPSQIQILDRLQKLEELFAARESVRMNGFDQISIGDSSTTDKPPQQPDLVSQVRSLDQDVALLQSMYLDDLMLTQAEVPPSRLLYRTCSAKSIAQKQLWYCHHDLTTSIQVEPVRCIWLPLYTEATVLVQKFVRVAAHFPWVTHPPLLPRMLHDVYAALQQRQQVRPGPLVLLLAIFACVTHLWTVQDCAENDLYESVADAVNQSLSWINAVQDVIRIARDHTTLSVEGVSGSVIVACLLLKLEGMSPRCRAAFAATIAMTRDLGLHRIDHPNTRYDPDTVETELARRVFWFVCASDWKFGARFGGINDGVYTFHPRQIITRRPKHANDDNVLLDLPLSTPTTMSYPLHRIRIADICRGFVDRNPLASAHLGDPTQESIMDIDTELQILLNEVQPFFSSTQSELIAKYQLKAEMADDIIQQGHTLRFLLHAQRCKLHLPYFTRGYTTSASAPSKDICIKSARLLIQSQSHLSDICSLRGTMFPMAGLLLGVFMASIVLLVDLCMTKSRGQDDENRGEVCQALKLLESAKHESEASARFIDSLTHILRKHKITPRRNAVRSLETTQAGTHDTIFAESIPNQSAVSFATPNSTAFADLSCDVDVVEVTGDIGDKSLSSYLNDLAQSFDQSQGIRDEYDWENIFSDLNNSIFESA